MPPIAYVRRAAALGTVAAAVVLAPAAAADAAVASTSVSSDPFTNATSQHATQVEPDTFAYGSTVVAAFQSGRFTDGGASDIGYARSGDGGQTWSTKSFLPGITSTSGAFSQGGQYERVSDASVAYDAKHRTWMVSSIPIDSAGNVPVILVSRSTDDGMTFGAPVTVPPPLRRPNLDKNWTVCDNHVASPYYGHCYTEFDNYGEGDVEYMSTSTDGGATWSQPATAGQAKGLGGQPVVRPDGTVVVPFETTKGSIASFRSTNGGLSWSSPVTISRASFHAVAAGLRTDPLPSAEIDRTGTTYVAWADCRFETRCTANDIVYSTSADGTSWTAVKRVPLDPVGSGVDHFIPGIGVDETTSGSGAHIGLTYYSYRAANCTAATCQLDVSSVSSPDGGAHWSAPTLLAGPMSVDDIAQTTQGPMVGDYISTSFNGAGTFTTTFAWGKPHSGSVYDEAMYAPSAPLAVATSATATRAATTAGAVSGSAGVGTVLQMLRRD